MKYLVKSILALVLFGGSVFAQTDFGFLDEPKGKEFYVDVAFFKEKAENRWRLEAYYKIFNHKLSFIKLDDKFRASYEIGLKVFDSRKRQVTAGSLQEDYDAMTYNQTTSLSDFLINQLKAYLLPGDYELEFTLNDLNSSQRWSSKMDLRVPELAVQGPMLSGVEFARSISDTVTNTKFEKNGKEVIPSVSRIFGDPEPEIPVYYEIYKGRGEDESYILEYRIWNVMTKEKVLEVVDTLELREEVHGVFRSFEMGGFPEGEYTLLVKMSDFQGKVLDQREERLFVELSLLSLLKTDYQKAVEQLRYIASSEEMNRLKEASQEERLQLWVDFWRSKDPTPQTVENEIQEEYYRRLRYANANFAFSKKEGWKTDMGRIYIIYGHPDEVERHPFEMETKPYQIWYYYKRSIEVVFVDKSGYGEYEIESIYERGVKRR